MNKPGLTASLVHGLPPDQESGIGALTIPGYLREVTTRYADREALVMHTGDSATRWSYQQLWDHSYAVARALVAAGVEPHERVGILMTNRPEFLSALFGIAMVGGVAVVFSTFSTATELEQLLELSDITVLLYEDRVLKIDFADMLVALDPALAEPVDGVLHARKFPGLRQLVHLQGVTAVATAAAPAGSVPPPGKPWQDFIDVGSAVAEDEVSARMASLSPLDPGGLFFSSGTTSLPKGILHAQRAFALQWWRFPTLTDIDGAVRCLSTNGLFWSGNIAMAVGLPLTAGGSMVLQPFFDADEALRLIESERVSFLYGRPHQWARLQEANGYPDADLSSLRYITRGEPLWNHPTITTDWVIPMGYGNTETMSISTSNAFNTTPEMKPNSFGTPLPGNVLKIVDPLSGEILPVGSSGEICIKGPTLMTTYIGKTADEIFDEDGFFHTGDGGYVDSDGCMFWEGRITDIIKTGGANVSPVEIDELLARFPGVKRAQTVGMPHATLGEMIVSCIVPHQDLALDETAITAYLKQHLASFKVPKKILFFKEGELDVTGSGKVKVMQLRDQVSERL